MPTYDYVCTACNHAWELEQRISENAIDTCPKCSEKTAKRQISGGAGFILKGGGWYADLYSSTKPSDSKGTSTSTPAASSAPKAETKAEPASTSTSTTTSSS